MRARVFFILLAILLVAGFAALNWPEFQRSSPLSFGVGVVEAPLGIVMLGIVGVVLLAFLLASAASETRYLVESRQSARELERQRELADRAEASRFTDLRQHLDMQLKELRQRDAIAATELEKARLETGRELRSQLEAMNRLLSARLGELESRFDARLAGRPVPEPAASARVRSERV